MARIAADLTPAVRHAATDSFDEDFKTLVKQTLNDPTLLSPRGAYLDDDLDDLMVSFHLARLVNDDEGLTYCSQPIEIDWNRRRTHSLDELDARDMHMRRKEQQHANEFTDDEWRDDDELTSDDEFMFALEL
ncbi:Aste57867_22695 [Aphanomyces stellatus]|uniref:Aste57867_22695 protein n=1 Tax=Aphanomyces stellatus TaxID=120398 RepID=A0A485LLC4_9STRA|nr:hypothetical protein As57867_022625 [Aphanomyces stellatus]VFT99349.1 Aste57867_22695 [Aphanomyces stellatus]